MVIMNMDLAVNLAVLLLSVLMLLWSTILTAFGKKIIKNSNLIIFLLQIIVFLFAISRVMDNMFIMGLIVLGIVILLAFISYFSGVSYSVNTEDKEELCGIINKSLHDINGKPPKVVEEKDKTKFFVIDSKKSIEVKEQFTISEKKKYNIIFKRWLDNWTKKEILIDVENTFYRKG